ncbi:MAG: hypothetical protein M1813_000230 [Trichoglossum hirsutum]|nr:MAG: hypothetical protein M1813_000230 [Trichoglossum hirsutum]
MTQIIQLKMSDGTSAQDLIQQFNRLWSELQNTQYGDAEERWKRFQATDNLTYEKAGIMLRNEEIHRENNHEAQDENLAMGAFSKNEKLRQ